MDDQPDMRHIHGVVRHPMSPKNTIPLLLTLLGLTSFSQAVTIVQDFEGVTVPALPSGWQAVGSGVDEANLAAELSDITKLKGQIELVDNLPNDGMVIVDERDYSK